MAEFVKVAHENDIPLIERLFYEFEKETVIFFNIVSTFIEVRGGHFYVESPGDW